MSYKLRSTIALIIVLLLLMQTLTACGKDSAGIILDENVSGSLITENKTTENVIKEKVTKEHKITEDFIRENIIYENGVYECVIDENTICETYIIEIKVGETTEEEIAAQLPEHFDDFDIDWKSVIAKFAVGTTIIVAVGVVGVATRGASYFVFGTPVTVAKDAFIFGATAAATNVVIGSAKDRQISKKATKYAIEGFADGYMWGAITSVLKTPARNVLNKNGLKLASGETANIRADSTVVGANGDNLGYIRYSKDRMYLVSGEDYSRAKVLKVFNAEGKEIVGKRSPIYNKNAIISGGGKFYYTDDNGIPYKERVGLIKKVKYTLNKYNYTTDRRGRVVEVEAKKLRLRPPESGPRSKNLDGIPVPGIEKGKDKSHLIAAMFDGKDDLGNLVAMPAKVNRGEYEALEKLWLKELKNGKNVSVKILLKYNGRSKTPSEFDITYWIGKKEYHKLIINSALKGEYYEIKYAA